MRKLCFAALLILGSPIVHAMDMIGGTGSPNADPNQVVLNQNGLQSGASFYVGIGQFQNGIYTAYLQSQGILYSSGSTVTADSQTIRNDYTNKYLHIGSTVTGTSLSIDGGLAYGGTSLHSIGGTTYVAASSDTVIYADATSGPATIQMPVAATLRNITVVKADVTANPVIINFQGVDRLLGGFLTNSLKSLSTYYYLNSIDQSVTLQGLASSVYSILSANNTPPFVGPGIWPSTNVGVTTSSDVVFCDFYITSAVRITGMTYNVGTQNGSGDFGVYSSTGGVITTVGNTVLGGAGASQNNFGGATFLLPGQYKIAGQLNNVTATLGGTTVAAGTIPFCHQMANTGSGTLPAQLTLPGTNYSKAFDLKLTVTGGAASP